MTKQQEAAEVAAKIAARLGFSDLHIERWAPGDGATRYRLTVDGGSYEVTSYFLGIGAFLDFLHGMERTLRCADLRAKDARRVAAQRRNDDDR